MSFNKSQAAFFQALKLSLPSYTSLVDEIAEILEISIDSAYRRIRGEKLLDFSELEILCNRFNISVDSFLNLNSNAILFQGNQNDYQENSFTKWMEDVLAQLNLVNSFSKKHIYWLVKDMPPFHHYYHKELAAFKFFFWRKSILFTDSLKNCKYSIHDNSYDQYAEVTQKILKVYHKIPTTEIWNIESINITLRQIELYHEMGIMTAVEDTVFLYNCMLEVIDNLEKMAEKGKKILPSHPDIEGADYTFFVNEFIIGDNTFFATMDERKVTYLNHSVIYFHGTSDPKFNDAMFRNLENLIKKSNQISLVAEKERKQFFNKLRKKVTNQLNATVEKEE
ncbi:hypothetical protein LV84_03041 [Algoriphagus ratkowskyi]|uniref:BetR domain-containing protein n=1 Tax=Algoriphagus ratkowskyi TaxID=57028 RepID=A0A2W7QZF9_9BACT|nr:hypothetical protein [Algoriphagus ratkowskyi]PZX53933.1 hypothetical protein LV84_03041 [Algoriphagus ratkowskyi]TXD76667.1 hypothetical protein ESW18_14990 [Algoriphagus ratkowskyi]